MAGANTDRLPLYTWLLPPLGLAAWAVLGKAAALPAVLLLAALLIGGVLAAVHHAEVVAMRVGEPFGALVLALAVTIIEVGLIVSIMLSEPSPELARDSVHATVMIVLHGIAGLCIVVATWREKEGEFRVEGASAFLAVLLPMMTLVLVLPNHVVSVPGPYYSGPQLAFVAIACLALYGVFLFAQTVRYREYFLPLDGGEAPHARPPARLALFAFGLLVVALAAVVLLAKALAPAITGAVAALGAPAKLVGVIVAGIVLLPETLAAVRSAARGRLQSSINLALGSAVACVGLTVPAVAVVSGWLGQELTLGIEPGATVLLALSFLVAIITYGTGRTNLLAGCVHLVLFVAYVFYVFVP